MRFHKGQHQHGCGIDLHARSMYVRILDDRGKVLRPPEPEDAAGGPPGSPAPYRQTLVAAVECIQTWYWLADPRAALGAGAWAARTADRSEDRV